MFTALLEKVKGWKTIIWARFLVLLGLVVTVLSALDVVQLDAILPDKYKPFAPMLLAVIGAITEGLRWVTTGPVGSKETLDPGRPS